MACEGNRPVELCGSCSERRRVPDVPQTELPSPTSPSRLSLQLAALSSQLAGSSESIESEAKESKEPDELSLAKKALGSQLSARREPRDTTER